MGSLIEKTLPELLRALLLEQIDSGITLLSDNSPDFNYMIHNMRTGFKKIRAYLLLLRTDLGEDLYKNESRLFRDEGKGIADLRDSYVVYMTMEQLVVKYPDQLHNNTVAYIKNILAQDYETKKKLAIEQDELTKLAARLQENKIRILDWNLPEGNEGLIFDMLRDRYATGVLQMSESKTGKSDKKLHNWRKDVKHLWYQVRVFEPFKPDILTAYCELLHSLSDFLGEDHDLVVLNENLHESGDIEKQNGIKIIKQCINAERAKLQTGAFSVAGDIFAEPADRFADRITGYWRNRTKTPA